MKKIRIFFNIIKQSFKSIRKNFFMVFASVIVVFAVLLLLGAIEVISKNINDIMNQFADRAEVQINLKYFVTEETAKEYQEAIEKDYRVKSVKFISKEENLNNILSYYEDEKELFETYKNSEKLQFVTLEVELNAYADGESFVKQAKEIDGVDNVKDIVGTITKMEVAEFWLRIVNIIAVIAVIVLSMLLIFNTVKLAVFSRKREIEIMKYIGATDAYIASPFVAEGVFTGIFGSALAFLGVRLIYEGLFKQITKSGFLGDIKLLPVGDCAGVKMLIIFLVFGIISGFIASYLAVYRYIDV